MVRGPNKMEQERICAKGITARFHKSFTFYGVRQGTGGRFCAKAKGKDRKNWDGTAGWLWRSRDVYGEEGPRTAMWVEVHLISELPTMGRTTRQKNRAKDSRLDSGC